MVSVPRVTPFRVLAPWTGVPTIIGLPLESTTRYRPFASGVVVCVAPWPVTVAAGLTEAGTLPARALAALRRVFCTPLPELAGSALAALL